MNHEQPPTGEQPAHPIDQAAASRLAEPPLPEPEQHEDQATPLPRIWVGSLADYNNGILHGAWIDAAQDPEEIQADIDSMLAASPLTARTGEPAEEWHIYDFTGFGNCQLRGLTDLELVSQIAQGIVEHGLAFAGWAGLIEHPELLPNFDQAYLGEYDSLEAYVEQLVNDLGYDDLLDRVVPTSLRPYVKINITATANDLLLGGDLHAVPAADGGVWIFRG